MINIVNALGSGLLAGIAMFSSGGLMKYIKVTNMDMMGYEGCAMTGNFSLTTYIITILLHLAASAFGGIIYALGFTYIWGSAGWVPGLIGAFIHWFISGILLYFFDKINSCVKNKKIQPMKFFATGYGWSGFMTLLLDHLLFGLVMGLTYHVI